MSAFFVNQHEVGTESACTHWSGWGKSAAAAEPYELRLSHFEVVQRFSHYWNDFAGRESEPDGTETPPGVYAELQSVCYPSIEVMLSAYGGLLSRLILDGLQTEFLGFMVAQPTEVPVGSFGYFLRSITSIEVQASYVVVKGECVGFYRREP